MIALKAVLIVLLTALSEISLSMPKFAPTGLTQREQVEAPQQRQSLGVMAEPVMPLSVAETNLGRLSQALDRFITPEVKALGEQDIQDQMGQDKALAAKHQMSGTPMDPMGSRAYQETYSSLQGVSLAQQAHQEVTDLVESNKHDPHFDPAGAVQRIINRDLQGMADPHVIAAYTHNMQTSKAQAVQAFAATQRDMQQQEAERQVTSLVSSAVQAHAGNPQGFITQLDALRDLGLEQGIPKQKTDTIAYHAILGQVAEGDLNAAKLVDIKGKAGLTLGGLVDPGGMHLQSAIRAGQSKLDKEMMDNTIGRRVQEMGTIREEYQQLDPGVDPYQYAASKVSKFGPIHDSNSAINLAEEITRWRQQGAKTSSLDNIDPSMWATLGPTMGEAYTQRLKQVTQQIWGGVNPSDPTAVSKAIGSSLQFMQAHPGVVEDGLKRWVETASMLPVGDKDIDKLEKIPPSLEMLSQAHSSMATVPGARQALFGDKINTLMSFYNDMKAAGVASTTAWNRTKEVWNNPDNPRKLDSQVHFAMEKDIQNFAEDGLGDPNAANSTALKMKAGKLSRLLRQSTSLSDEEIRQQVVKNIKENTVNIGNGKTYFYKNDVISNPQDFSNAANKYIEEHFMAEGSIPKEWKEKGFYAAQAPESGDLIFFSHATGNPVGRATLTDLMSSLESYKASNGQSVDQAQQLKQWLATGQLPELSSVELAGMEPYYNVLKQAKALDDGMANNWRKMQFRAATLDNEQKDGLLKFMADHNDWLGKGQIKNLDYYPTHVPNPGGADLPTLEYAKQLAKGEKSSYAATTMGGQKAYALAASLAAINEGIRTALYDDNKGKAIGMGFNVDAHGKDKALQYLRNAAVADPEAVLSGRAKMTVQNALDLHGYVVQKEYEPIAKKAFGGGYDHLPPNAKAVLIDIAYNTGDVGQFRTFMNHFRTGDYESAGKALSIKYTKDGKQVTNTKRVQLYQRMLAGENAWLTFLDQTDRQSK